MRNGNLLRYEILESGNCGMLLAVNQRVESAGVWNSPQVDASIAVTDLMKPEIGNVIALNDVVRPPDYIGGYSNYAECQQS